MKKILISFFIITAFLLSPVYTKAMTRQEQIASLQAQLNSLILTLNQLLAGQNKSTSIKVDTSSIGDIVINTNNSVVFPVKLNNFKNPENYTFYVNLITDDGKICTIQSESGVPNTKEALFSFAFDGKSSSSYSCLNNMKLVLPAKVKISVGAIYGVIDPTSISDATVYAYKGIGDNFITFKAF